VGALATIQIKPSLTFGRVNWPKFKKLVTVNINLKPSLKTTFEIDSAILSLTSTIQNSASAEFLHPEIILIFLPISCSYSPINAEPEPNGIDLNIHRTKQLLII
jgi:hypothetical protein